MAEEYAELVEVDWTLVELGIFDTIQGYLVEHPEHYYMAPSEQWLCILVRDRGLILLENDFTGMSEEDIGEYIFGVLEMMNND